MMRTENGQWVSIISTGPTSVSARDYYSFHSSMKNGNIKNLPLESQCEDERVQDCKLKYMPCPSMEHGIFKF